MYLVKEKINFVRNVASIKNQRLGAMSWRPRTGPSSQKTTSLTHSLDHVNKTHFSLSYSRTLSIPRSSRFHLQRLYHSRRKAFQYSLRRRCHVGAAGKRAAAFEPAYQIAMHVDFAIAPHTAIAAALPSQALAFGIAQRAV